MNKIVYIIALLMVAGGVYIFSSLTGDVSTYANFTDANSNSDNVKLIGNLAKDMPMQYDAEKEPNLFKFYITDKNGVQKQVILNKPKPFDFERSEEVVVTGKMKGEVFYAHDVTMKCPSKYKNEEISLKDNS